MRIHEDQISRYGGSSGVRDMDLLSSAVQQPQAGFGGEYLHRDLFEMAAGYLYHISRNHPFIDGNKRCAAAAAVVFLTLNKVELRSEDEGLERIAIAAAQDLAKTAQIAEFFRSITE